LAATIAHEIATPLATIGMHADEIASVWSHVFKGYRTAVSHGLYDDHGHSGQSERISQLATAIRREVSGTSAMVEMALASFTLDRLDRSRFSAHPVQQCVTSALERYPFRGDERARVTVAPFDPALCFSGSDTVVIFVLFNLLKMHCMPFAWAVTARSRSAPFWTRTSAYCNSATRGRALRPTSCPISSTPSSRPSGTVAAPAWG
jgi:signal transduction histidine kinase